MVVKRAKGLRNRDPCIFHSKEIEICIYLLLLFLLYPSFFFRRSSILTENV